MIGAGAAGLTAAISAGRSKKDPVSAVLFDSRSKIGAKILVSGGTRCNVTNKSVRPSDYQGAPSHYVKHALAAFTPAQTIRFFEEIGVELVLEPTGKYFPTTHSGKTVLEALMKELERSGVTLETGVKIEAMRKKGDVFEMKVGERQLTARRVALCTGGLSLPETGSDGSGLRIAKELGHTIIPTFPALTPLETDDRDWTALSGITVEAELYFYARGKKQAESKGSFLFTHAGFSGPSALDISRHFASSDALDRRIEASFAPGENDEDVLRTIHNTKSKQLAKNFLMERLPMPERLAETLVRKAGIHPGAPMRDLRSEEQRLLARVLLHAPLSVTGVTGYKKAEVTAGGVDLKEVNISTMESKLVPGLFFAGEILDVDGRIGGFNFQWAWSTGMIAGRGVAKGLA